MTENERNEIINVSDIIKGEINRMCVTDELTELDTMYAHAKKNLDKLHRMIFESKFEFSDYPEQPYQFDNMTGSMNL